MVIPENKRDGWNWEPWVKFPVEVRDVIQRAGEVQYMLLPLEDRPDNNSREKVRWSHLEPMVTKEEVDEARASIEATLRAHASRVNA